jgi:hypothetical protein
MLGIKVSLRWFFYILLKLYKLPLNQTDRLTGHLLATPTVQVNRAAQLFLQLRLTVVLDSFSCTHLLKGFVLIGSPFLLHKGGLTMPKLNRLPPLIVQLNSCPVFAFN